jgi:hypothetical protein
MKKELLSTAAVSSRECEQIPGRYFAQKIELRKSKIKIKEGAIEIKKLSESQIDEDRIISLSKKIEIKG